MSVGLPWRYCVITVDRTGWLEARLVYGEAVASTVDWLMPWDGRDWSGGSAGVGLLGSAGVVVGEWPGWRWFHGVSPSCAWRDC